MDYILIKNENDKYSKWIIDDDNEWYYNISLSSNRSIVSAIGKNKIQKENEIKKSNIVKPCKEKYEFAFASFRILNLE